TMQKSYILSSAVLAVSLGFGGLSVAMAATDSTNEDKPNQDKAAATNDNDTKPLNKANKKKDDATDTDREEQQSTKEHKGGDSSNGTSANQRYGNKTRKDGDDNASKNTEKNG